MYNTWVVLKIFFWVIFPLLLGWAHHFDHFDHLVMIIIAAPDSPASVPVPGRLFTGFFLASTFLRRGVWATTPRPTVGQQEGIQ